MGNELNVTITNGTGTANVANGNYNVTATVDGYDNTTISPSTQTITEGDNDYAFTIAATGTLTLHVTAEGTEAGTNVVGATFIRADASGNTYGPTITSDASGNAVFENVPFSATGTPPTIYYLQTGTSSGNEYDATLKNTTLTAQTGTIQVANPAAAERTITLTDANYANLPVENGTITLERQA